MVGLVIVSHSVTLAEGVQELVNQMTQGKVPIALAAGLEDPEYPIGTDPARIMAAVEEVQEGDGVLVLMDLGSSLMNAELALELLSEEARKNVRITAAPLVEGAMAAAIQASIGADLASMVAEAEGIIDSKAKQLGVRVGGGGPTFSLLDTEPVPTSEESVELSVIIPNQLGLHARPSARVVGLLSAYDADVWLLRGKEVASAKSLNQIAMLAVQHGEKVIFRAKGRDAKDALAALKVLVYGNFGDIDKKKVGKEEDKVKATMGGIGVSPGTALGPIKWYQYSLARVKRREIADTDAEEIRLAEAIAMARIELSELQEEAVNRFGSTEEAEFFELHSMLLDDPYIVGTVHTLIHDLKMNAEAAWFETIKRTVKRYRALKNEYVRGRAIDVLDIGARVIRALTGKEEPGPVLTEPSILVVVDLGPTVLATLDTTNVLGIIAREGGPTSHVAIFSRALNIPAVVNVGTIARDLRNGTQVGLNGETGQVWVNPTIEDVALLQNLRNEWSEQLAAAKSLATAPAVTRDGKAIRIQANVGSREEVQLAMESGADGIGVLRTEFMYTNRNAPPSEDEQMQTYMEIAKSLNGAPLVVCTLDLSDNMHVPYLEKLSQSNQPVGGWRGIRFGLAHRDMFLQQIKALLRVAVRFPVKILLPMVSSLTEVRKTLALFGEARNELRRERISFADEVSLGIVLEVPSSIVLVDQFIKEADFFLIGTDDLISFVMASESKSSALFAEHDMLQPAVLRMVRDVVSTARQAGKEVNIGGVMTSNPLAIPLLIGLGLTEISVAPSAVAQAKEVVRSTVSYAAEKQALQALDLPDAASVTALLKF